MIYRHELKFQVSEGQIAVLKARLLPLMQQDAHQEDGMYNIRSLYFDDFYDSCLQENKDGIDNRKKYRIRIYNKSSEIINLEKKIKYRGMTRKIVATLTKEACLLYAQGKRPLLKENSTELEKEMYYQFCGNGMRPKCIVEYERTAFVEPRGNVRITFDRNISGCNITGAFLEEELPLIPLLPKGQHVLEVKYDEYLPQHIGQVLEIGTLQRSAFSKYRYARNYWN
ncbi:MAG: polyphosphate polymerase domain-containing protein [Lachnospiraceae bacterium]